MIKLSVNVLEDIIDQGIVEEMELGRADVSDAMLEYWKSALERLEDHPDLRSPALNKRLVEMGYGKEPVTCEVLLCSRASLEEMTDCGHAHGAHLISTPDFDPFNEETPFGRAYRVLVVSDQKEFLELMADLSRDDFNPERHQHEYLEAYLNTAFHEIAHVILFAENAALLSPHDVESLFEASEIAIDIPTCSTGYGIRPLTVHGTSVRALSWQDAEELMETYVEERGKELLAFALTGSQKPEAFPAAFGVQDAFERLMKGEIEVYSKQA